MLAWIIKHAVRCAVGAVLVLGATSVRADTIDQVTMCADVVQIHLQPSNKWLIVDHWAIGQEGAGRIYALALSAWLTGREVTWWHPQDNYLASTAAPCGVAGYLITVLRAQ
jgi:hypothetical protein